MKKWAGILLVIGLLALLLAGCGDAIKIDYPYTQEYIAGQGNVKGEVDTEKFLALSEDFAIGANQDGYAVFKDPVQAFSTFIQLYQEGIEKIQEENNLPVLTQDDYSDYKTLGWQLSSGNANEQEQARFVTAFLDIYENSFRTK